MKSDPRLAWLVRAIGVGLFVILIARSDPGAIAGVLRRANPATIGLAGLLIFPMIAFKTARWRDLQRAVRLPMAPFGESFRAYLEGLFAGLVTPGRVGEFVRVRSLTRQGAAFGPAMATVLWDRVFDVLGLFLLGSLALVPLAGTFRGLYVGSLAALGGGLLVTAFLVWGPTGGWRRFMTPRTPTQGHSGQGLAGKLRESLAGLLEASRSFRGGLLVRVGLLTLLGWVVYYAQAWLLARAIHLDLRLDALIVAVTAAAVAAFLPISISGIGTRDAALVVLFTRLGETREEALAYSALVLAMLLLNALVGLVASRWPVGEMARRVSD
ncbi:MAG TPA: lysylphosphatidylglycerol synthase transmembrane domain-containing protein [Candidatus Eisenbacteria bacterium]